MISDYATGFEERRFSASDGLQLYARDYGGDDLRARERPPVVCLAGLSRNSRDFHQFALLLSRHPTEPRRVVTLDYRGRGRSAWDAKPEHYNLTVECDDVLAATSALGIGHAVFVGTSRGGLILHMLGAIRPAMMLAVVLNDIGPVVESAGLVQIKAYLARGAAPKSWTDAAGLLKDIHGRAFPALSDQDWRDMADAIYLMRDGGLAADFDPALAAQLRAIDVNQPVPALWQQFTGLCAIPLLAIRGENSQLLSAATLEEMGRRHKTMRTVTVAGQGHAPLLHHRDVFPDIAAFLKN